MTSTSYAPAYVLGSTDPEHERLIRQAAHLGPSTEQFFREAGIGPGQRVLELGSGVGDVAMLVARLVGPSGTVVGIERDPRSITRARARVAEAGLENVSFIQADASQIEAREPFDALAGRSILQFLPDPAGALRSLVRLVRPGGVVVFQEASWEGCPPLWTHLPLWSAARSRARETLQRSGANPEIGLALHHVFQEAGLPAPAMKMEVPVGTGPQFVRAMYDLLCTLLPEAEKLNLPSGALGEFSMLWERFQAEAAASNGVVGWWIAVVGAWARKGQV